jgi:hypothetical protein
MGRCGCFETGRGIGLLPPAEIKDNLEMSFGARSLLALKRKCILRIRLALKRHASTVISETAKLLFYGSFCIMPGIVLAKSL